MPVLDEGTTPAIRAGLCAVLLAGVFQPVAEADSVVELQQRVAELEAELSAARKALEEERQRRQTPEEPEASGLSIGPLTLGGAIRVNYVYGSYEGTDGAPSRGGDGGNVELDTFRINADLAHGPWLGKLEYRWYTAGSGKSYSFFHTAWLGYEFPEAGQLVVGLNRVPFGPGPYGVSQSWFFDQHYYVGLADDPDLGVRYEYSLGKWQWDMGYYWRNDPSFSGRSEDSARYGYDAVRWREAIDEQGNVIYGAGRSGYREKNQFNVRGRYTLEGEALQSELGISLQYGDLVGSQVRDGHHWAASMHGVTKVAGITLATQLTRYEFSVDDNNPWGGDALIPLGAYDFAWPVATEAWLPAVSLSYRLDTPELPALDYVRPYVEWSSIIKEESSFEDSQLFIIGAAWARGSWYLYSDLAWSNGNLFVGDEGDNYSRVDGVGDFGVNGNDRWNYRFNLNLGFYY